jgi:hypothetical protein
VRAAGLLVLRAGLRVSQACRQSHAFCSAHAAEHPEARLCAEASAAAISMLDRMLVLLLR